MKTATLFSSTNFECVGEGNPQPTYQWLQTLPTRSNLVVERGRESKLHISNVTYDFQGEYRCKVTNIISGTERSEISEAVILQVVGKEIKRFFLITHSIACYCIFYVVIVVDHFAIENKL